MTKRIIKTLFPLFLGMSLLFIGNGLVVSSLSAMLKSKEISEIAIGLINSCLFVGAILSTLTSHVIVSKVGHVRAFAIFSALFAVASLMYEISLNLYFWAFLRMCLGYCYYALLVVIESWLNERAKDKIRSRILAFYEGVFYISFGLGILIMALELSQTQVFIISAAFIMLSSIPLNLIKTKEPRLPERESVSLPKIFNIAPLALTGSFIAGILINGFFTMASIFILSQNFSLSQASYFMAFAMIGGFVSQFFMGGFSDKFGRRMAIITSCLIGLTASITFLFANDNLNMLYLIAFFLGSGIFCLYALSLARANDMLTHKSQSIQVGRTLLFSYSFGSLVASSIMGVMMSLFGAAGFIYVYIVLLIILLGFAITQKTVPLKHRQTYNPYTIKTTIIDELKINDEISDIKAKTKA
ncbi:MFS transporter [Campylobacter majalis]|uniref:MFS transporter n=1 Tax=Campylobacter majalis TaxID=2790656 RepID=UPI003D691140